MGKEYNQLSFKERCLIEHLSGEGKSIREIGKLLGRSAGTISRECKRNIRKGKYESIAAQSWSEINNSTCLHRKRIGNDELRIYIEDKLKLGWSPELISGRIKLDGKLEKVSHETIYQWIYKEAPEYREYLTRKHRKRWQKRRNKKAKRIHIPARINISKRPDSVNNREEYGHWETDTMAFKKRGAALQVVIERKSRMARLRKIKSNQSKYSSKAILDILKYFPRFYRNTITYDNGRENVQHVFINTTFDMKSYFCDPYCGWQKGTVENSIGLIRRFFPKRRTNGENITDKEIKKVEHWLNHRPRKCLGFKTPYEVFKQSVALHS
jgi:IS30 family transposase